MLAQNPAAYDRKLITIEACGSVTSSPIFEENYVIIFEPGCAESDAWASIQLDPSEKRNPELDEFINSATPEIREAKLVVEGQFDQWPVWAASHPDSELRRQPSSCCPRLQGSPCLRCLSEILVDRFR
jgi:hypothetical protein